MLMVNAGLGLRAPARASGVACSIAFQYFRPQPLWIPISWNTLFFSINAGMVCLLLKEESDANKQDQEAAHLYDEVLHHFVTSQG